MSADNPLNPSPVTTVQEIVDSLCDLDADHLLDDAVGVEYENKIQLNWLDGSNIRLTLTTNSMTPDGVRLKPNNLLFSTGNTQANVEARVANGLQEDNGNDFGAR